MSLGRLTKGEWISSISAVVLFALTFFHWYDVEVANTSNFLFAVEGGGPGRSAWGALEYTPIVLVIAVTATLVAAALRLTNAVRIPPLATNGVTAMLGVVSTLLIAFRIIDPPIFYTDLLIKSEGAVQVPIVLALLAALGIASGSCLALWERGLRIGRRHEH